MRCENKTRFFFTLCIGSINKERHIWVFDNKSHNFTVNENCNPLFCFMFSVKLTYGMSKNNRMLMIVNGYKFSLHYSRNCKERWQCTRRSYFGCKAVLHKKEGAITYQNIFHNHEPWCFLVHVTTMWYYFVWISMQLAQFFYVLLHETMTCDI